MRDCSVYMLITHFTPLNTPWINPHTLTCTILFFLWLKSIPRHSRVLSWTIFFNFSYCEYCCNKHKSNIFLFCEFFFLVKCLNLWDRCKQLGFLNHMEADIFFININLVLQKCWSRQSANNKIGVHFPTHVNIGCFCSS